MAEHDEQHGYGDDEQDGTGECGCGATTDYYGPDPYRVEMCGTSGPCLDCSCWEEDWICDACYQQACEGI